MTNPLTKRGVVKLEENPLKPITNLVGASWTYNYTPNPVIIQNVECVPMVGAFIPPTVGGNSEWIMGFNEPDMPGKSGEAFITPTAAVSLWYDLENTYSTYKLVAPAPTSHICFDGYVHWITDFIDAYYSVYSVWPRFNALAIHIYSGLASDGIQVVTEAIQQAKRYKIDLGIPVEEVWVTEFGDHWAKPPQSAFSLFELRKFINWMNNEKFVTRYAWFKNYGTPDRWKELGWEDMSLVTSAGELTIWGQEYTKKVYKTYLPIIRR